MNTQLKVERRTKIHEAIRQAALEEFACNGLNGASTKAIANRAGLSKPQLHYYITGKEELYEETLLSIIKTWDAHFFDSVASDDPKTVISTYIENKIRYTLEHPLECRLFSQEVSRGAPVLRRYWEHSKSASMRANDIINGWIKAGKIRPIDPMIFQMELWAVTQHYADYESQVRFFLNLNDDEPLDASRLITHAQTLFLRGVGIDC